MRDTKINTTHPKEHLVFKHYFLKTQNKITTDCHINKLTSESIYQLKLFCFVLKWDCIQILSHKDKYLNIISRSHAL